MEKIVQIIPMGIDRDRSIYLLKQFPPHKIYFIRNSNHPKQHEKMEKIVDDIQKELESLMPLADKKYHKMDYSDFKQPFIDFLKIIQKEKKRGNKVIINLSSPSRIIAFAAWLAGSLTKCEVYYIQANVYGLKGEFHSKGVAKMVPVTHFPITLPNKTERKILEYLLKHKSVTMKLRDIVKTIGVENVGGVRTLQSGIVRMSYVLRDLKSKGYIDIESVSKKNQRISLTESGEIIGRAVETLKD